MLPDLATCGQRSDSAGFRGGFCGGVRGFEGGKSFFVSFASSPGAKLFCIVLDSPCLSTTLISWTPGGIDENVPRDPMEPSKLLSRYTCASRLQPRICMLAGCGGGGGGGGGWEVATADSATGNALSPLACTAIVCFCVSYPERENSISCWPGFSLMLQWGVTHSCPVATIRTVAPRG